MRNSQYIVRLSGGLGNQMFQYAAARALSLRHGASLAADLTWFSQPFNIQTTPREYALYAFRLNLPEADKRTVATLRLNPAALRIVSFLRHRICFPSRFLPWHITEPTFDYWDGFRDILPPAYLDGYWQSERYFSKYSDIIRADFSLRSISEKVAGMSAKIASVQDSVSLHIRRGDYVNNFAARSVHGIDTKEYYTKSLERIAARIGTTIIFAFSDDPRWVRANFDFGKHKGIVVDGGWTAHEDMHLMSLCSHHIIANSSFSWWGAWLSTSRGITIAPKSWFSNPHIWTPDVCPATWERIPC